MNPEYSKINEMLWKLQAWNETWYCKLPISAKPSSGIVGKSWWKLEIKSLKIKYSYLLFSWIIPCIESEARAFTVSASSFSSLSASHWDLLSCVAILLIPGQNLPVNKKHNKIKKKRIEFDSLHVDSLLLHILMINYQSSWLTSINNNVSIRDW